jgi:hypothetical protein
VHASHKGAHARRCLRQTVAAAGEDAVDCVATADGVSCCALVWRPPRRAAATAALAPLRLPHPAAVLSAAWRPPPGRHALLTWGADGTARLWVEPPSASAVPPEPARGQLRLVCAAALTPQPPLRAPPAWTQPLPAPGERAPRAAAACPPGAWVSSASHAGDVTLWACVALDEPPPRPAPRFVRVAVTEALLPPAVEGAAGEAAVAVALRRGASARANAPPCDAAAWGVEASGAVWRSRGALVPETDGAAGACDDAPAASRGRFALEGHSADVTSLASPPPHDEDDTDDADDDHGRAAVAGDDAITAASVDAGGGARLWRLSASGDVAPAGPLPPLPRGGAVCAVAAPGGALLAAAGPSGAAVYPLNAAGAAGAAVALAEAAASGAAAAPPLCRVIALLALPRAALGTTAAGAPRPSACIAALCDGGAEVRVWALFHGHAAPPSSRLMAAWRLPVAALAFAAPAPSPAAPATWPLPYALATACADASIRLWAPPLPQPPPTSAAAALAAEALPSWRDAGTLTLPSPASLLACAPGGGVLAVALSACPNELSLWQAERHPDGVWRPDGAPLSDASGAVRVAAWLPAGAGPPLLAVCWPGGVRVCCRARAAAGAAAAWVTIARLPPTSPGAAPLAALAWHPRGALLTAAGAELCGVAPCAHDPATEALHAQLRSAAQRSGFDRTADAFDQALNEESADDDAAPTLCAAAAAAGGALPSWHPASLCAWLAAQQPGRARVAVRSLAAQLRAHKDGAPPPPPPRVADVLAAGAAGSAPARPGGRVRAPRAPRGNIFAPGGAVAADDESASDSDDDAALRRRGGATAAAPASGGAAACAPLFSADEAEDVAELVATAAPEWLPGLAREDTLWLLAALDALAAADAPPPPGGGALDAAASRCRASLAAARLAERRGGVDPDANAAAAARHRARAAGWAVHSETRDALLAACLGGAAPTWPALRACAATLWLPAAATLRTTCEAAARNAYLAAKQPGDAALLYVALGRAPVLAALYRSAGDKQMPAFLSRNFADAKNRGAAAKNAYALLGTHRHALAAAFFLLGGSPGDAASIAARRLRDIPLAVAVARLADASAPDSGAAAGASATGWGAISAALVEAELLPDARAEGDAWSAHALLWQLGRRDDAVAAIAAGAAHDGAAAELCGVLGACPKLRASNPRAAGVAAAAAAAARQHVACAAEAEGLPLTALEWLAQPSAAVEPPLPAAAEGDAPAEPLPPPPPEHGSLAPAAASALRRTLAARFAASALAHSAAGCAASPTGAWQPEVQAGAAALAALMAAHAEGDDASPSEAHAITRALGRQLRLAHPPPPAPLPPPSPPRTPRSPPPPHAPRLSSSHAVPPLPPPTADVSHHRRRDASGGLGSGGAAGGASSLFRSSSVPSFTSESVLSPGFEVVRVAGELFRGVAVAPDAPCAVAVATLRRGLLAGDLRAAGGGADGGVGGAMERAGAAHGDADAWGATRARWPAHAWTPPSPSSSAGMQPAALSAVDCFARCLAAHPCEGWLACGAAAPGGGVSLWRFGAPSAAATLAWPLTAPSPAIAAVAWDGCGARIAAAGADGVVAIWRAGGGGPSAPSLLPVFPGGAACGVAWLSPTVLAIAGAPSASGDGASLVLWDTLCPPKTRAAAAAAGSRVAGFAAHAGAGGAAALAAVAAAPGAGLNATCVLSGGAAAGDVAAFDLRTAAASGAAAPLWRSAGGDGGAGAGAATLGVASWGGAGGVALCGDRGGDLRVWCLRSGRALQTQHAAHPRAAFAATPRAGGGAIAAGVTSLLVLPGGVLSCGADGTCKLHRRLL